jgi:hypothetical protein
VVMDGEEGELELELIQSHMAQKPMLRGEVGACALRGVLDVRGHGQVRLCKALGCGRCGCLKPIRACCVVGSAFFLVAPPRGGCAMAPRDSGMCWEQFMMCLEEIRRAAGGLRRQQQQLRRQGSTLAPLHSQTRLTDANSSVGPGRAWGVNDRPPQTESPPNTS